MQYRSDSSSYESLRFFVPKITKRGIIMDITLRSMTREERIYSYTQSSQIGSQTGNIGHLRADMDSGGESFFSTWFDFRKDLKTGEFKAELDDVINHFRFSDVLGEDFLKNRTALSKYCFAHPEASNQDFRDFFFRADTEEYAYLFRLNPYKGEYNMYCYCYRRDWLDHHLKEAQRGIRFIDSDYRGQFWLRDGGKIRITFRDDVQERICRYIDSTHFEYGTGPLSIFHIAEFAEWVEAAGAHVEPVNEADISKDSQRTSMDRGR